MAVLKIVPKLYQEKISEKLKEEISLVTTGEAKYYNRLYKFFQYTDIQCTADVFHAESTGHIFRQAFLDAGLKLAQCLIWEKNAFVLGRQDYQRRHEPCLYGWKEGAAHYFINDRTQDTVILEDDIDFSAMKKNELVAYLEELRRKNRDQTSVIYENKPTRNDIHPTMKPIALVGKFITNSSKSGWNVLDLFGGSGSTLMAAEQLGRTAFIMELDERFCDVIVKRWEDYTGQQAVRIPAEDVK